MTWRYALCAMLLLAIVSLCYDTKGAEQQQQLQQQMEPHAPGTVIDPTNGMTRMRRNTIRQISILGERSSGTRWTYEYVGFVISSHSYHYCSKYSQKCSSRCCSHLSKCFNHTLYVSYTRLLTKCFHHATLLDVILLQSRVYLFVLLFLLEKIERDLTRYKHWFQYRNASKYRHDALVIAQFRNPYDWLEAMREVPHHAPNHQYMHWSQFLTKPWTMNRTGLDIGMSPNSRCQQEFQYNQIVSCNIEPLPPSSFDHKIRYSEHQPFYELHQDGSGKAFGNIMEMRSAKIRNFLDIKEYQGVADVWVVQYEYLLETGTKRLVDLISEWTGVEAKCDPFPAQNREKRKLSRRFVKFINENLDWTAEGLIGYTQVQHRVGESWVRADGH